MVMSLMFPTFVKIYNWEHLHIYSYENINRIPYDQDCFQIKWNPKGELILKEGLQYNNYKIWLYKIKFEENFLNIFLYIDGRKAPQESQIYNYKYE